MIVKPSKTLIGAFVIGAVFIGVAGILFLGSGRFFTTIHKDVMFFEESVKGLQIGAPVVFHGVKIGQVTDVVLVATRDLSALIPVYIEIYPHRIIQLANEHNEQSYLQELIQKGLRAQLQTQSLVTGQLMVNLDFYPHTPIKVVGLDKRYPEIPTVPSGLEQLTKKLERLPLQEVTEGLNEAIAGINRVVNSRDLQESIGSLNRLLKDSDGLVNNLNGQVGNIASDLRETTGAARAALGQAQKTLALEEGTPGQIASGIKETLATANATLKDAHVAVEHLNVVAVQNPNLGHQIGRAIEQISQLSRSVRVLTDYLERHPESLLRGKSPPKGE